MEHEIELQPLLQYIDPSFCTYQEWTNVGMALKLEGYAVSDWDAWSLRDTARYHAGECEKKWRTFNGANTPVTGATIVDMAKKGGWHADAGSGHAFDWDDVIQEKDEQVIIDQRWLEGRELQDPGSTWNPVQDLITYLSTLFDSTDYVGYVTSSWEKYGQFFPSKGNFKRTAGELLESLTICDGDIGAVLGDYKPKVGAWIRFNPLDGKGIRNENVTDFKYALVESDCMELEKQNEIIRQLELPVACLVYSGGKSIHAIVHIDASSYDEYRKRVDYLYAICRKNGLEIDQQNRNPSRLSRMPGVMRGDKKQYLIDTHIGKANFVEWREWIEAINDDLPDPESLKDVWNNMPELSPSLIEGVLRQGHKMMLAGPSKAGKSYALIELTAAIAEGRKWLTWDCAQGKVLYVNLELDRASCLHRFKDVYDALGWPAQNLRNIDIWNLRGKSIPMDKLAPKLIRRAARKDYLAIIIDPIYKIITGDENSADQMAHFCNQFDKVCTELNCAVIYCHHHSKGSQGGKRSMDRASGSGVFARDADALLDMIQLEVDQVGVPGTGWRLEGTLREFRTFEPLNLWFEYPIHKIDDSGTLASLTPDAEKEPWKKSQEVRQKKKEAKKSQMESAYNACLINGDVTVTDMANYLETTDRTVRRYINESKMFEYREGKVIKKKIECDGI
jgi:RecA-family ATPase